MCVKHARFAAFYAVTIDQNHGHKVDAVAMRAFGRWAANALGRVDAKLMSFDELTLAKTSPSPESKARQLSSSQTVGKIGSNNRSMPPCSAL